MPGGPSGEGAEGGGRRRDRDVDHVPRLPCVGLRGEVAARPRQATIALPRRLRPSPHNKSALHPLAGMARTFPVCGKRHKQTLAMFQKPGKFPATHF